MKNKYLSFFLLFLFFFSFSFRMYGNEVMVSTNNWYIGDTDPGEWFKFKRVWLSAGYYRFTTRAVAKVPGQTVHLEINDATLNACVEVPSNEKDTFQLVHLGHCQLAAGYYDLKFVFETGQVNCDMIFIRKDKNSTDQVLDSDTQYDLNFSDGMHTFAIGGHASSTRELAKGEDGGDDAVWTDANKNKYNRKQVDSWNKQLIYNFTLPYTKESADMYIQEMVEAKVEVIYAHGRGEPTTNTKQIEDRAFMTGPGGMPCSGLKYVIDAIKRNPYANNKIKLAYFIDNAPFPLAITKYLNEVMVWGNTTHQQFIWDYAIKKWYQAVPRDMLYFTADGKVPMQWWSANANMNYNVCGTNIREFFDFIQKKMQEEFNLTPAFILDDTFSSRDTRVNYITWGKQAWFSWGKNITQIKLFLGKEFAFAFNGGRKPLQSTVLNDWNPVTNTGTFATDDCHINSLDDSGNPRIRPVFVDGHDQNAEWIVLEAWGDWREGSTYYRSNHPEYKFPNQYISLVREFADTTSSSIVLEAEGCDEFSDKTVGNSGGSYRLNWYKDLDKEYWDANLSVDLDIYRPLHKLSDISRQYDANDTPFEKISAGVRDVWAFKSDHKIYCNEIDGYPVASWQAAQQSGYQAKDLSLGCNTVWMISTSGDVLKANLPDGSGCQVSSGWTKVNDANIQIVDLEATISMAWGIDSNHKVYYRNLSGSRPWVQVPGELISITADESSVWGFNPNGELVRMSAQSKDQWTKVDNPYHLTKLSAGCGEIWGVNADNEIYRKDGSASGKWQYVNKGFKDVSVGVDYAWLLDTEGVPYKYELSGFENSTVFADHVLSGLDAPQSTVSDLKVVPNPFQSRTTVIFNVSDAENVVMTLSTMNGLTIKRMKSKLHPGTNEIELTDLDNLNDGMYLLNVESREFTRRMKIVKSSK